MTKTVAHFNVRLSEGGAAMVAWGLAESAPAFGWNAKFVYGYGPNGGDSPRNGTPNTYRLTPKAMAAANMAAFRVTGRDLDITTSAQRALLNEVLADTDVVHLHVIHSHFIGAASLLKTLARAGKPVVWTMHDMWLLTGRCALPGNGLTCEGWRSGCPTCPHLDAYPGALRQTTASGWAYRRDAVLELAARVNLRVVPCADWLAGRAREAGLPNVTHVANSVDPGFWAACQQPAPALLGDEPRVVFVARDLADAGKVNQGIVAEVGARAQLTLVGNNPPEAFQGLTRVPAISDRTALVETLRQHNRMLYTSTVDMFPLTIAEGLAAGLDVYALSSDAAREFQRHPRMHVLPADQLVDAVVAPVTPREPEPPAPWLDPLYMAGKYHALYEDLLAGRTAG